MKLHLGCGKRFLPGFIHVDIEKYEHIQIHSPMHDLHQIESATVEEMYSSHAFEYYEREFAGKVLLEWLRILKPGGQLYLSVPDFEALVEIYNSTGDLKNILGPLFGRWHNVELNSTIFHKTVYNKKDLSDLLQAAGFEMVLPFDPVEYLQKISTEYDDYSLAYYPHMDRSGIQVSLTLKATKPKDSK
jgi:predicted SAM-dependent methyltransferase